MNRYVIGFSKSGFIKYTSHLDMLRFFKRALKKADIRLEYSQGFNPHPKMGFAQPLSLGYTSKCELLEIETKEKYDINDIKQRLDNIMTEGIKITFVRELKENIKSIAANVSGANYIVYMPVKSDSRDFDAVLQDYLSQDRIIGLKKQKKTKKLVETDIKSKIRKISIIPNEHLILNMNLDCGSNSNLSPELVISTFMDFAQLPIERYDVEVERTSMEFENNLKF